MSCRTLTTAPLLVTPTSLTNTRANNNNTIILDASWHMPNLSPPRSAHSDFLSGPRIPGARFWDVDAVATLEPTEEEERERGRLPHMMPSRERFKEECEKLGIGRDDHVVIYDTTGVFSSPRTLFTFRHFGHTNSSILNGGLPSYLSHSPSLPIDSTRLPSHSASHPPQRSTYSLPPTTTSTSTRVHSYSSLLSLLPSSHTTTLDARPSARFHGTAPEPRPGLSSGHMPHSLSLPFSELLEGGKLKSVEGLKSVLEGVMGEERLREVLGGRGETSREVVWTCGSGMTAAVGWLAINVLAEAEAGAGAGETRVGIYDESWMGYAARKGSEILKTGTGTGSESG